MIVEGRVYSAFDLVNGGAIFHELTLEGKPCPARFAIFGDPVAHSASPEMQNAALRANGHDCQYVRIRVAPEELKEALGNLDGAGFLGANLTIPHKQAVLEYVDEITDAARALGSINTVSVINGNLLGHNTDGPGFAAAIREEFALELRDQHILILGGAGGAGRAIAVQCLIEGGIPIIANRNKTKGDSLIAEISKDRAWSDAAGIFQSIDMDEESLRRAFAESSLIVNGTPLGMKKNDPSPLPDGLLTEDHLVYDTVYSGGKSALIRQAEAVGARSANGLPMLLHQGALAYQFWFPEAKAPLEIMRAELMKTMESKKMS